MQKPGLVYKPQIEGVEGALPSRVSSVCAAVIAAALVALLLGSNALLNWVNNLPIGPVSDFLLLLSQDWQNWMAALHITAFSTALNNGLTWFQALH